MPCRQGLKVPGASAFAASLAHSEHKILKLVHMGHDISRPQAIILSMGLACRHEVSESKPLQKHPFVGAQRAAPLIEIIVFGRSVLRPYFIYYADQNGDTQGN